MKTLKDYNKEVLKDRHQKERTRGLNGIACPICEEELHDDHPGTDEGVVFNSKWWEIFTNKPDDSPPQRYVHCRACGWTGTRFF